MLGFVDDPCTVLETEDRGPCDRSCADRKAVPRSWLPGTPCPIREVRVGSPAGRPPTGRSFRATCRSTAGSPTSTVAAAPVCPRKGDENPSPPCPRRNRGAEPHRRASAKRSKIAGAARSESSLNSALHRSAVPPSVRMLACFRVDVRPQAGLRRRGPPARARCSNATAAPACGVSRSPTVCRAAPTQAASCHPRRRGHRGFRRTVANLASASSIDQPSRSSRPANNDQSPLAEARHQAASRRAAMSASLFAQAVAGRHRRASSSMVAARTVRARNQTPSDLPGRSSGAADYLAAHRLGEFTEKPQSIRPLPAALLILLEN